MIYSNPKQNIGQLARETRKSKGYGSMREIAAKLKISVNDISEIERGIFRGSMDNVLKYLSYIGLTLQAVPKVQPTMDDWDDIFGDEDD